MGAAAHNITVRPCTVWHCVIAAAATGNSARGRALADRDQGSISTESNAIFAQELPEGRT
jgi:hypothetical protein